MNQLPAPPPDLLPILRRRTVLAALWLILLTACGQSGPLYLPEEQPVPPPQTAETEEAQTEEEESDGTTP